MKRISQTRFFSAPAGRVGNGHSAPPMLQTAPMIWANLRLWKAWLVPFTLLAYWAAGILTLCPQWAAYTQYSYGWAVPILCLHLLHLRWSDRAEPQPRATALTLGVAGLAVVLMLPTRIIVEANPIWRLGSWGLGLEFIALALAVLYRVGGTPWLKHFGFPFAFYLVSIPWPSGVENVIIQTMTRFNSSLVVELLSFLGVPAIKHGNVIEISRGLVGIDEACSGIRSLQATVMIGFFFGELYRLTARQRLGLLGCGVALALLCNTIRTFTLVRVSSLWGNTAMEKWHDPTGIGILLVCFTMVWFVGLKLRRKAATPVPVKETAATLATLVLRPRWLPVGLCLWLAAVELGTSAWFAFRSHAPGGLTKLAITWPVGTEKYHEIELSPRVRTEMAFDTGQAAAWAEDRLQWQVFHFSWGPARNRFDRIRVQLAKSHRPEICLPASGREIREDRGTLTFRTGETTLPFRSFCFDDRGAALFVYFCAWEDGIEGQSAFMRESTASRLAAAWAGSRSESQRALEAAVWGASNAAEADAAFQRMLNLILPR